MNYLGPQEVRKCDVTGRLKNCFCTEFCCANLKTYCMWIKLAYWKDHLVRNRDSLAVRLPTPDMERGDFRSFHIS